MAAACLQSRNEHLIHLRRYSGNRARVSCCAILSLLFLTVSLEQEAKGAVILTSSFSILERYNDNLFFSDQDKRSDFTTVLSPSLSIAITSKNATLTIGYHGSAQFHSQNPEADGYFQSLSFDIDLPILNRQIRGLEVNVTEKISYSPELPAYSFRSEETETDVDERFDQVLLEGEGVQQAGRVNTFRNHAGISLRYPWSQNFSTSASYANVITRYSGGELEDTEVNNGSAEARYRYPMSLRTEWTSSYGYDLFHQINTGVSHRLTHLVSVSGSVGVSFIEGESPKTNLGAGISKRYKTGSLNLRYSSNLVTGLGVIRGVTRRQSVVGSATRVLGQRISSSVQLGYASNRSFEGNEVDVATYTARAGLYIRLLSWLNGSLNYAYLNQQSKGNLGEDGERNVVSFALTAVGPSWRIIK